jgi:hypothetical protein
MQKMPKSKLTSILFSDHTFLYAIIDAAKIEELTTNLLIYEPEYRILFEEQDAVELEEVAPYIVELYEDDLFSRWVIEEVYGNDGAIFLQSRYDIDTLADHFKRFLHVSREIAHPETGKLVIQEGILAYYDPRVLPEWLESVDVEKKKAFLSMSETLFYEDMIDKSLIHEYATDGTQHQHTISEVA